MLNIKVVSWSLGIFTALSFVLCVVYGLIVPARLHAACARAFVVRVFYFLMNALRLLRSKRKRPMHAPACTGRWCRINDWRCTG